MRHNAMFSCTEEPRDTHAALTTLLTQELSTFGFRGEALSSLCALAELSVVTRTADQEVKKGTASSHCTQPCRSSTLGHGQACHAAYGGRQPCTNLSGPTPYI